MKRTFILLAVCLAVASTAGAARVSRARRLQEISWPRCVCDEYRGENPYYVTYLETVPFRIDTNNETNSRLFHRLEINTLPYNTKPPGVECWDVLLQELHKVMFDVSADCKAAFNSAGNTVTVNGSKWSNFQYVIDRNDTIPKLAELKIVGLQNFTYAATQKSFIIEIGTVNNTCKNPAIFFKSLEERVSFMDKPQKCCGQPRQDFFFPPPPPPLGFPHPGCGVDRMNDIPFKLEWAPPKDGNPCFKIVQKATCDSECCGMMVQKIEFLQKPFCSVSNPGRAPLKFKSYEDTGFELNAGSNFTTFTGLSATGAQTSTNPVYGVVKANNLKWSNQDALDRTICLLMDEKAAGTAPVDCSKINNNFFIPFGGYYGIPYSIFNSTSSGGCCGNGFLYPQDGFWPTGEAGPVVN